MGTREVKSPPCVPRLPLLIAPTEPPSLKVLGKSSSIPERYGADVLWVARGIGLVGIQRKERKDLVRSIYDGRLAREVALMQRLRIAILIVEGRMRWTTDGQLFDQFCKWTRKQHRALLLSAQLRGIKLVTTEDLTDTIEAIETIRDWVGKERHTALDRRPNAQGAWGKAGHRDFGIHILQGFPGIGPVEAGAIFDHFGGRVPLGLDCTEKELRAVPGIGPKKAKGIVTALHAKV